MYVEAVIKIYARIKFIITPAANINIFIIGCLFAKFLLSFIFSEPSWLFLSSPFSP